VENVKPIISGMSCKMRQAPILLRTVSPDGTGPPSPIPRSSILHFSTSGVSVGPVGPTRCKLATGLVEGEKKAMGGFPGNLGMALGHLVHARAPGVVSPMGCQQIMRLGPSQVTSCSFAFASTAGPLLRPMSFPSWPPTSSYG
jgi:hypothetical protein